MQVENTENQRIAAYKSRKITISGTNDFASNLKNQQIFNTGFSQKIDTFSASTLSTNIVPAAQTPHTTSPESNNIKLGTLSGSNKTVAQLLLAHPELKTKTWSIIHNPVNRNKAFHQIATGKEIYYNRKTQELHWSEFKNPEPDKSAELNSDKHPILPVSSLKKMNITTISEAGQKIILGQINQDNPNISSLLSQQSDFKAQRWNIIHSELNQNKAFTKIPNGTTIYIDNKSKELSWNMPALIPALIPKKGLKTVPPVTDQNKILAKKLDDAVKPFMGTDYKHLDCYTLVVNGLENMGVRYRGKGSLSRQLLHRAQIDGLVNNAYFTGEGITEALGEKIYTRSITRVNNIEQQSKDVFREMQNLMKRGDILSFSLQTQGHTGIISQNKEQWTYINSGRLDHSITTNAPKHGVGEETLLKEINNWIKLAQQRKELLQITVGRLFA